MNIVLVHSILGLQPFESPAPTAGSFGGVTELRFFLPYQAFTKAHLRGQEISDGVVTVSSAKWGIFDPHLWPGDHADEIGHDLDLPISKPDAVTQDRYEQIVLRF